MKLPFTTEQFLDVFSRYNIAVQPLQIFMYLLAIIALALYVTNHKHGGSILSLILALMWLVNGIAYHIIFFSKINPIAKVFGGLFIIQAIIFMVASLKLKNPSQEPNTTLRNVAGWTIIIYGMIIYSVLGFFLGHQYPAAPIFGVAPCPTAIFTLGVLILLHNRISKLAYIIPFIWVVIGSSAAFKLGIKEDLGLLISGIIALLFLVKLPHRSHT